MGLIQNNLNPSTPLDDSAGGVTTKMVSPYKGKRAVVLAQPGVVMRRPKLARLTAGIANACLNPQDTPEFPRAGVQIDS